MAQVGEPRRRGAARLAEEVDVDVVDPRHVLVHDVGEEVREREAAGPDVVGHEAPARVPGGEHGEQQDADEEREPATVGDLEQVGPDGGSFGEQEKHADRACLRRAPSEAVTGHDVKEDRR